LEIKLTRFIYSGSLGWSWFLLDCEPQPSSEHWVRMR